MLEAPKGLRRHIVLVGRRNAGKSTLLNALSGQDVAIVSPEPGTTTDPVEKTMEMGALGPVVLVDTAGTDDIGELGKTRIARTMRILKRADYALLVTEGDRWEGTESELLTDLQEQGLPLLIVRNWRDGLQGEAEEWKDRHAIAAHVPVLDVNAHTGAGVEALKRNLEEGVDSLPEPPLAHDLVPLKGVVVLVVPLDSGAPKGRLILPQVQTIRDLLDAQRICLVCTEKELRDSLAALASPPDLVVCDSQVAALVAEQTPPEIPLTTFSILMARARGELRSLANGARAVARLRPGQPVLIQEACSHHPQKDDIGRVKIPRLIQKLAGGSLDIDFAAGKEITAYDRPYAAIIHCGACTITRTQMLARQALAHENNSPMTNYGMTITLAHGLLERMLRPFPAALAAFLGTGSE